MNRDDLEASIAARNPEVWRPPQISSKVSQEMDELIRCRAIQGMDELMYCRAILDQAGDFSTSIHGGIEALVAERDSLPRALGTSVMCPKCAEVILPHQQIR